MKKPVIQFLLSIFFLLLIRFFISVSETDLWLGVFLLVLIFIGIPVFILSWIEFGDFLRQQRNAPAWVRFVGFVFGVPQALFGLVTFIIGVAIVVWVLYNSLIEQQESYTGGFMTFGMSTLFIGFGLFLMASAFKKDGDV